MSENIAVNVSIIIPAYNSAVYIAETLNSVIAQSFTNWECIIVDNGSTDKTKQVVENFVSKDKRFQYHSCEQNGVSFARNLAVEKSRGKYILPLVTWVFLIPNACFNESKILLIIVLNPL